MRKGQFLLITLLLAALAATHAQTSGTFSDGLTWALSADGTLTIGGSGQMPQSMSGGSAQPWEKVLNQIKSVIIEDGASGVLSIRAFANCINLTQLTIGKGITGIRDYVIEKTGLTSLTIPEQIVSIDINSFMGAAKLETVYFNAANCADMGAILDYPPFHRTKTPAIKTVVIGDSVIRIPAQLFSGANTVTSLTIGANVTEIGMHAFADCTGLTGIAIPDSVVEIKNYAFRDCANVTSITLGENLSIVMPGAFVGSRITEITIPQNVTRLSDGCFNNSTRLTTVYYNAAASQGNIASAFTNCPLLETMIFGDSVRTIPSAVAKGLAGLYSVTIGSRVTGFEGYYSFEGCIALEEIIIHARRPPARISNGTFGGVDKSFVVVRVPAASVDAYKAANHWKDFTIEPLN